MRLTATKRHAIVARSIKEMDTLTPGGAKVTLLQHSVITPGMHLRAALYTFRADCQCKQMRVGDLSQWCTGWTYMKTTHAREGQVFSDEPGHHEVVFQCVETLRHERNESCQKPIHLCIL